MQSLGGGKVFLSRDGETTETTLHYLKRLVGRLKNVYNEGVKGRGYPVILVVDFNEESGDVTLNFDETEFPYMESDIDLEDIF